MDKYIGHCGNCNKVYETRFDCGLCAVCCVDLHDGFRCQKREYPEEEKK